MPDWLSFDALTKFATGLVTLIVAGGLVYGLWHRQKYADLEAAYQNMKKLAEGFKMIIEADGDFLDRLKDADDREEATKKIELRQAVRNEAIEKSSHHHRRPDGGDVPGTIEGQRR